MKKLVIASLWLICSAAIGAQGQIPNFKHIIVVVQENRTPDNLFQGLCNAPFGNSTSCSTTPGPGQYNILTSNWLDKTSSTGVTQPKKVTLANTYDLDHSHTGFNEMCDMVGGTCKMDGAAGISCNPQTGTTCPGSPQFKFVINKKGILNPYLQLATQYGWANYMFQTNQGPSFPAHQFLFGATSAPTTQDDGMGIYASENMLKTGGTGGTDIVAGCTAATKTQVKVIMPDGTENTTTFPCFEHQTLGDMLDAGPGPNPVTGISWRYYAPSLGSIWTAPNAIRHICEPSGPDGDCAGPIFQEHVDVPTKVQPAPPGANMGSVDILNDISSCSLRNVSWVIPSCQNSDHASCNDGGGPSWVASIVNAVGKATSCDGNGYWNDTAIVITWDDWGGWYDHEAPTILQPPFGAYQYGFRVPMIFVSAYTPPAYINNNRHDFGSIVKFIQKNFGLTEGGLTFADQRSKTNLGEFYDLTQPPRPFQSLTASRPASFFLKDKRKILDPDDQ